MIVDVDNLTVRMIFSQISSPFFPAFKISLFYFRQIESVLKKYHGGFFTNIPCLVVCND